MPRYDPKAIGHALDVLKEMVACKEQRDLTAGEKLACRVLASVIGTNAMKVWCDCFLNTGLIVRTGHLSMRYEAIEGAVRRAMSKPA